MTTNRASKRSLSQAFWIGLTLSACIFGLIVGILGTMMFQRAGSWPKLPNKVQDPQPTISQAFPAKYPTPPWEGLFLTQNGELLELPGWADDQAVDLTQIPVIDGSSPTFVIRGTTFPMGKLKLFLCLAGIGAELEYGTSGAIVKAVVSDSPAQSAGLFPGDLVTSINGQSTTIPPGHYVPNGDLLGNLGDELTLQVLSGTSARTVQVKRLYRAGIVSNPTMIEPDFQFEIEPQDGFVVIRLIQELASGIYAFEFWEPVRQYVLPVPAATPTSQVPLARWMFRIQ